MTIGIRPYQQRAIDSLYDWWMRHDADQIPLIAMPTGSGKSIVIAELVRLLWDTWPDDHPRTVVLVPSKELAQQNAEKLAALMPAHRSVGYYSASLGQKRQDADVIVATIGSIYRDAHLLGSIRCVIVDEAHLVNPDGVGRYRKFFADLSVYNQLACVGLTATPFRGNGIWLTDGSSPLFHGIACEVGIRELIEAGFLAPLIRPVDVLETRIDTDDVAIVNGDYRIDDLAERVGRYIPNVVAETLKLAGDRKKWIAFTPTVDTAERLAATFVESGVSAAVVCGATPKADREQLVSDFRAGRLRCLVTVLALATGFDVPDVDCVIWCRPTRSPVLYVQGAGRGTRPAAGKTDCLWLDFSDTTERLGPIDMIRGRRKGPPSDVGAPYAICGECGAHVRPASLTHCPECGALLREPKKDLARGPSDAAVLSKQLGRKINDYPVTDVRYSRHVKAGSPDSLRVDYYSGLRRVVSEWICLEHGGFAGGKAAAWWSRRTQQDSYLTPDVTAALKWIADGHRLARPSMVRVDKTGRWPEIINFTWGHDEQDRVTESASGSAQAA